MKTVVLDKEHHCEVCGGFMDAGETALVRYDYDWDDPDEDRQGSVAVPFYRHADKVKCEGQMEINRLASKIDAQQEEDEFHHATQ